MAKSATLKLSGIDIYVASVARVLCQEAQQDPDLIVPFSAMVEVDGVTGPMSGTWAQWMNYVGEAESQLQAAHKRMAAQFSTEAGRA